MKSPHSHDPPATQQRAARSGEATAGSVKSDGCNLYYEVVGEGVPILLIHPAGATASTWGAAPEELARIGRVIVYDRRGYARSGGAPVHSMSTHTADAAALLEQLRTPPAVVVGTSAGAAIADRSGGAPSPRVLNLVYPSRTRVMLSVLETRNGGPDATRSQRGVLVRRVSPARRPFFTTFQKCSIASPGLLMGKGIQRLSSAVRH